MSDQAAKMIEVEFVKSPATMDADFGDVKFVSVGNVEIGLEETADGVVITAKDADGVETALVRNGKDADTPVKGTDYYTEADKAEMVTAVLAALPVYAGEVETV